MAEEKSPARVHPANCVVLGIGDAEMVLTWAQYPDAERRIKRLAQMLDSVRVGSIQVECDQGLCSIPPGTLIRIPGVHPDLEAAKARDAAKGKPADPETPKHRAGRPDEPRTF